MRPSQSKVMKRKVGSTYVVEDLEGELVLFGDAWPVVDARAA